MRIKILFTIAILLFVLYVQTDAFISEALQHQQKAIQYHDDQDYLNAALEYYRAAGAYKESHNIIKSIELYTLSAPLFEQLAIKDLKDQDYKNAAWNCKYAAIAYKEIDNTAKFIELLELAASLFEKAAIEDQNHNRHSDAAWSYQCTAIIYKKIDNTIKYTYMLQKSAETYEQEAIKYDIEKDYSNATRNYKKAARIYKDLGCKSKAIELYTTIIKIYVENGYEGDAAIIHSIIRELQRQNNVIDFIKNHYHYMLLGSLMIVIILIGYF